MIRFSANLTRVRPGHITALLVLLTAFATSCRETRSAEGPDVQTDSAVGQRIGDFVLSDYRSQSTTWSLSNQTADATGTVVLFLGTECPLVKLYAPRLESLYRKTAGRGMVFVGINANQQDSLEEIGSFVRQHDITFPMLKDAGNVVADQFGAERTPEVFVLDADHVVRYHGRIDDQFVPGISSVKVAHDYLADAVQALLENRPVPIAETEPVGCHIGRVLEPQADAQVTYANQISRILQQNCVSCHRAGEIGPFALTDYDEVVGWAQMIDEVVQQRRMPPWHASPEHGAFLNDARLSEMERKQIHAWVAAGAPLGDPAQLPPPAQFTEGWRIGEPDQIVYMSDTAFEVPAEGEVDYKYFVVDPGFTEDKWIRAAECRPGNRAVVHHIIVAQKRNKEDAAEAVHGVRTEWIAATAPGARPMILPEGMAKFVPAGAKLVFQMHYTPIGTPQKDRSCIGFIFADPSTVRQEVFTQQAANGRFTIPPHASNHHVDAHYDFQQDCLMLGMFPHMHLRGKSFRYTAKYPDGRTEILLDIPQYDFNWQNSYVFTEPKLMPRGTRLLCTAHYDNSADNLANPDPTIPVKWGDQTWDEMMIGYFSMTLAHQDLTREPRPQPTPDAAGLQWTDELQQLSRTAHQSQSDWKRWAMAVRTQMPQLARVDLIVLDGQQVEVARVAEEGGTPLLGRQYDVDGLKLVEYARQTPTRRHDNLALEKAPDLKLFSHRFQSSVHVPARQGTRRGLVSFWSRQRQAFSDENAQDLRRLVQLVFDETSADESPADHQ